MNILIGILLIIAIISFFVVMFTLANRKNEQDKQARLNYERHQMDMKRKEALGASMVGGERAGQRRAGEHDWNRK